MEISVSTLSNWCKNNDEFAKIFFNMPNDASTRCKRQNLSRNITQRRKKENVVSYDNNLEKYMLETIESLKKDAKKGDLASAVEYSLLKRALGYNYTEERTEYTEKTGKKTVITKKHAPPDTTAQMLWLKNHKPDIWKEKKDSSDQEKLFEIKISLVDNGGDNGN